MHFFFIMKTSSNTGKYCDEWGNVAVSDTIYNFRKMSYTWLEMKTFSQKRE